MNIRERKYLARSREMLVEIWIMLLAGRKGGGEHHLRWVDEIGNLSIAWN
jgi:hypothetical protein